MPRRLKRWVIVGLLALAGVVVLAAASLPYLPLIHGTTSDEVERLTAWLDVQPGMYVAEVGAGDGTFAVALARRVGPSGHMYATELDATRLADIRQAATDAGLSAWSLRADDVVFHEKLPEGRTRPRFRFVPGAASASVAQGQTAPRWGAG